MSTAEIHPNPVGSTSTFIPQGFLEKPDVLRFVSRFIELNGEVEENGDTLARNLHYPRSKEWRLDRGGNF